MGLFGLGLVVMVLLPGLTGIWAVRHLLGLAELPDCRATAATDDSLSARLYCADEIARKQTVGDLRDAIKLASSIPEDDPLRPVSDRRIEQWAQDLLNLGEKSYQEGNLDEAVSAARAVPINTKTYASAKEHIDQWKTNWEKGQDIYDQSKAEINQQNWNYSLKVAKGLLTLGNRYWESKYQELINELQAAKEQRSQDKTAKNNAKPGKGGNATYEADAVSRLKRAKELALLGTAKSLKEAIEQAQQVYYGTPTYDEAQKLVDTWQQQIGAMEDRRHLDRAIQLAKKADEKSLQAGIDEAYEVSPSGSLYDEARRRIDQWTDQLYRLKYPPLKESIQPATKNDRPVAPTPAREAPDLPPP